MCYIVQARIIVPGIERKVEVFKYSLARIVLKYFSNLLILRESEHISDCYLVACINNLDDFRHLKIRFGDLMNIHVPDWLATPYDIQINSKGHKFNIEDELIEMHVDLEAKPLFKGKNLAEYWSNIITVTTNP